MPERDRWTIPESGLESLADSKTQAASDQNDSQQQRPHGLPAMDGEEPGPLLPDSRDFKGLGGGPIVGPAGRVDAGDFGGRPAAGASQTTLPAARESAAPVAVLAPMEKVELGDGLSTPALAMTAPPDRSLPASETGVASSAPPHRTFGAPAGSWTEQLEALKFRIHRRLIEGLETRKMDGLPPGTVKAQIEQAARAILHTEAPEVIGVTRDQLVSAILDEVLGFGPIEPLLRDPSLSEVMVNGPDAVYFERAGRLTRSNVKFRDTAHVMRIVDRILAPLGRRVDEASPMVDARLPDGSRVNVVIPPVSPKVPIITIRKFKADKMRMEDLIGVGAITERAGDFLCACVAIRRNIIVSGGTGSGKTTLLNALSASIPDDERIVTIEDPAELRLQQQHVISMEARPPGIEGSGEITTRQIVRNALRMRPDRIIVGECRGSEAFDMLQAMNTGHEGSLSTVHANTPRDALSRIESMVLMTGLELPLPVIRQQIAAAIHLIVQVSRFKDGSRKVVDISEITGMESSVISMQSLFKFENEGMDEQHKVLGRLRCQGLRPNFAGEFELAGIQMAPDFFRREADM